MEKPRRRTGAQKPAESEGGELTLSASLQIASRQGALGSERWMDLLARLGESRSITQAARAAKISYKAAWDAISSMNNLADGPLVERSVGGKGGGGTRLTARGERLVAVYAAAQAEHGRFLDRLNRTLGQAGDDLNLLGRLAMMTSARNQFAGRVTAVHTGAVNDEVEVALAGGGRIVAVVTRRSVESMGLAKGRSVVALVKASWVIVGVPEKQPMQLSARNQLPGVVTRLAKGAVNTEVELDIGGGNTVVAIITNASAVSLKLAVGAAAVAIFKASSVILGVQG